MSDDRRWLTTDEERERLYTARRQGGVCAACGRKLPAGEPVYWEPFTVGRARGYASRPQAPVGAECASSWLVEEKANEEPEHCAGCGRPVYYASRRQGRQLAVCSARCRVRASASQRAVPAGED